MVAGLVVATMLAACSSDPGAQGGRDAPAQTRQLESGPTSGGPAVTVVASTNVYGDIVEKIGGDRVSVTSIISGPEQDPHSYEANTQDQLALSKAALVLENGGGYDDFVDSMLATAARDDVTVLNAVELSGISPESDGELNEHVWYRFPAMSVLGGRIADALSAIDPSGAHAYRANAASFEEGLADLDTAVAAIKDAHHGTPIAITEPLPLYLLEAAGLDNKTPKRFSDAIEEDTDVSPLAMKETVDLFTGKQVAALVYNAQTIGPATEQVLQAARSNDIPVVPVTETLPAELDYLSWMANTVRALTAALDEGPSGP